MAVLYLRVYLEVIECRNQNDFVLILVAAILHQAPDVSNTRYYVNNNITSEIEFNIIHGIAQGDGVH